MFLDSEDDRIEMNTIEIKRFQVFEAAQKIIDELTKNITFVIAVTHIILTIEPTKEDIEAYKLKLEQK